MKKRIGIWISIVIVSLLIGITAAEPGTYFTDKEAQAIYDLLTANSYESTAGDYGILQIELVHPVVNIVKDYRINATNGSVTLNGSVASDGPMSSRDQVGVAFVLAGELRRMNCNNIHIELPSMATTASFDGTSITSQDGRYFCFVTNEAKYSKDDTDKSVVQKLLPKGWVVNEVNEESEGYHNAGVAIADGLKKPIATMTIISPGVQLGQITEQTRAGFNDVLATRHIDKLHF